MDISTILLERANFNDNLFSMNFPSIVHYIENNPDKIQEIDWNLFTNPNIRKSKEIDNYPEIILRHPDWPWNFNIDEIRNRLNRKIEDLEEVAENNDSNKEDFLSKIVSYFKQMEKETKSSEEIKRIESEKIIQEVRQRIIREKEREIILKQKIEEIMNEESSDDEDILFDIEKDEMDNLSDNSLEDSFFSDDSEDTYI